MIEDILNRLHHVKPKGRNTWIACCPAHNDKNPSLSIALTSNQRILIKCFAGCEAIEIIHAIGLELKDLFPDRGLNPYGRMQKLSYEHEQQTKHEKEIEHAKITMALYESWKERGMKLNRENREYVFQAYQLLRKENEN